MDDPSCRSHCEFNEPPKRPRIPRLSGPLLTAQEWLKVLALRKRVETDRLGGPQDGRLR